MRILFVTPAFPPFPGGGERYARSLALSLTEQGHQITVITSSARTEPDLWKRSAITTPLLEADGPLAVIRCPLRGVPGGWPGLLAWRKSMVLLSALPGNQSRLLLWLAQQVPPLAGLEKTLAQQTETFDLVHAFNISWEYPLVAAWRLARQRGLPFVATPFTHLGVGTADRVARNSTMDHQLHLLRDADAVLALTSLERDGLMALGVQPRKIDTVGSGLDLPPLLDDPAKLVARFQLPSPFVLFVGRVSYDKGAIHAAEAVIALRRQGVAVTLALIGQIAPEFDRFWRRLQAVDQAAIRPLGLLNESEKHALLSASQMLLLPSRTDSFGLVLLEAWAHGKPVIGARAGGIPGVIDEAQNGFLVDFADVTALAAAIRRLLTDKALRQTMGAAGQNKVTTTYTWDRVAERVATTYQNLQRSAASR
jgi:glycogen synthase